MAPVGGREARRRRDGARCPASPIPTWAASSTTRTAASAGSLSTFAIRAGSRSRNRWCAISDVVAEGFSPGVLERLGLGYDVLRGIRPDIIYVQQSGMGSHGTYGRLRTVGPIAAAFAGTSEMSGLPEPAMPAGWGYSYLDWMGAYSFALAILGALYHRERTGEGQWIDASQCEAGLFLAGPAILDWSANGRVWTALGNRSPYKPAAPHGAYRCAGEDRWIAIACFTDEEWRALARVAGHPEWTRDPRFDSLAARLAHQDDLDAVVGAWTIEARRLRACMKAAASRRRSRRGLPDGRGPLRPRSPARASSMADRSHGHEDRHVAGRRAADEAQRDAGARRRPHQPRRARLRRGQRSYPHDAPGLFPKRRRAPRGGGCYLNIRPAAFCPNKSGPSRACGQRELHDRHRDQEPPHRVSRMTAQARPR